MTLNYLARKLGTIIKIVLTGVKLIMWLLIVLEGSCVSINRPNLRGWKPVGHQNNCTPLWEG